MRRITIFRAETPRWQVLPHRPCHPRRMVRDPGTEQPAVLHSFHLHPSLFSGKGRSGHFVAPYANFAEFVARLKVIESAMSDLSRTDGYRSSSYDGLLGRLDGLADRVSREAREQKRVLDIVDGRVRDGVEGAVRRIEENVERR